MIAKLWQNCMERKNAHERTGRTEPVNRRALTHGVGFRCQRFRDDLSISMLSCLVIANLLARITAS